MLKDRAVIRADNYDVENQPIGKGVEGMEYINTTCEGVTLVDGCEMPAAEQDASMIVDANRIVDLCKTILGLDDCGFAKAIEVLKNSNDLIAETIYKILIEERGA